MSWSYDTSLLTDRDKVRFFIGDVDTGHQILSNEEVTAALSLEPRVEFAAARCCESIAARQNTFSDDGSGEIAKRYLGLAKDLRQRGQISAAQPYAGGISASDNDAIDSDTDRPDQYFKVGMMDNPGAVNPNDPRRR